MSTFTMLLAVLGCGLLSIVYAAWAVQSVMAADAGNSRMKQIAAAIQEGAEAYLTRQYTTIGITGIVIFAQKCAYAGIRVSRIGVMTEARDGVQFFDRQDQPLTFSTPAYAHF